MSVEVAADVPQIDRILRNDDGKQIAKQMNDHYPYSSNMIKATEEPGIIEKLYRRIRVYSLAFQVMLDYKMANRHEKKIRKNLGISEEEDGDSYPEIVKLWNKVHERNADRMLRQIQKLAGFWVKVGQFLSSRSDIMPPVYLKTLSKLQDSLPPKAFLDIETTLSEELSAEERSLIKYIDPKPLATASIAQVHRGTLTNGREIVIKVQHRGVASLMLQDMENLRVILEILKKLEGSDFDYTPIAREYTAEVKKELDFHIEAKNMDDVRQLLEEQKVRVILPKAIPNLVKERVLVMDFCEGFPARNTSLFDTHKVDRKKFLDRICSAWAAQMHISGVFNADPHMGNILVSTLPQHDGDTSVPVLLDFGLTKRFEPHMKVAFARLMHALDETDVDSLLLSFEEMGMKMNRYDPFEDMAALQRSFKDPVPQSETNEVNKAKRIEYERRMEAMREDQGLEKGQKLRNPVDAWPQELILYGRVTNMLKGLCTSLDIPYPYLRTMARAARNTLNDEVPLDQKVLATNVHQSEPRVDTKLQRKLLEVVEKYKNTDDMLGLQICVMHKGKVVTNISSGVMGKINPRPITSSTMFCIFSISKSILAMGVLRLVEEGKIELDDPICKHWPAFAENGKEGITIRHALSHQTGLANVTPEKISIETLLDWEHMKEVVEKAAPTHGPGEETHYHSLSFAWICGGIVESVTGTPYEEYLNEKIIKPMNMEDSLYLGGLPKKMDHENRVVALTQKRYSFSSEREKMKKIMKEKQLKAASETSKDVNKDEKMQQALAKYRGAEQLTNPLIFNMRKVQEAKLPSANGYSSAFHLASLYSSFIGVQNGKSIISPTLLKEARTKQIASKSSLTSSKLLDDNSASFGLGFQLHDLVLPFGKNVTSIGHSGVGGNIVFAIPELKLSVAFTTNMLSQDQIVKREILRTIMKEFKVLPASGKKLTF